MVYSSHVSKGLIGQIRNQTRQSRRDEQAMTNDQITNLTSNLPTSGKVLVNFLRQSDSSRGRTTAKGDIQSAGRFTTLTAFAHTIKPFVTKA